MLGAKLSALGCHLACITAVFIIIIVFSFKRLCGGKLHEHICPFFFFESCDEDRMGGWVTVKLKMPAPVTELMAATLPTPLIMTSGTPVDPC